MTQHNSSPSSNPKSFNQSAIGLFIVGLLFVGCGYAMQQEQQYKEKNFTKTTGKVIENYISSYKPIPTDFRSSTTYVHRIDFIANGRLFNFTDIYGDGLDSFSVAKDGSVTVLYDPKNPANSPKAYRPYSIMKWNFFVFGSMMIILGVSTIVYKPQIASL
jgi:hypothetical protein